MKSLCATLALCSLLLFAKTIESRGGVGEYWKTVMNEQSMPQAIGGLLRDVPDSTPKKKANDCHEKMKKPFVGTEEFEPRPSVTSYHHGKSKAENSTKDTDSLPKSQAYPDKKPFVAKEEKQSSFDEDFEPRPSVTSYHDGESKAENSTKDTDSLPKSQAYPDKKPFVAKEEKQSSFDEDFEPRPNVSVYSD